MTRLPVYWYIKPILPTLALALPIGILGVLYIPDPLWGLNISARSSTFGGFYGLSVAFYWIAFQAAIWLPLYRAWRYHADQGIPTHRHTALMAGTALISLTLVWLIVSALVFTGARAAIQDANLSPWFPILKSTEYHTTLVWLTGNAFLAIAWLTVWTRWRTPYRDTFLTISIAIICHLLAFLILFMSNANYQLLIILAILATAVGLPAFRQLRDSETL